MQLKKKQNEFKVVRIIVNIELVEQIEKKKKTPNTHYIHHISEFFSHRTEIVRLLIFRRFRYSIYILRIFYSFF